jgi:hypothetical protein
LIEASLRCQQCKGIRADPKASLSDKGLYEPRILLHRNRSPNSRLVLEGGRRRGRDDDRRGRRCRRLATPDANPRQAHDGGPTRYPCKVVAHFRFHFSTHIKLRLADEIPAAAASSRRSRRRATRATRATRRIGGCSTFGNRRVKGINLDVPDNAQIVGSG